MSVCTPKSFDLTGKVALVTGASYGLGKRTDVVIGEPIRLSELCSTANPDAAELDRLTAILRDKVIELRGMAQEA